MAPYQQGGMMEGRLEQDSQTLSGGRNNEGPVLFREPGLLTLGPTRRSRNLRLSLLDHLRNIVSIQKDLVTEELKL
jgi:hypothetical protein